MDKQGQTKVARFFLVGSLCGGEETELGERQAGLSKLLKVLFILRINVFYMTSSPKGGKFKTVGSAQII